MVIEATLLVKPKTCISQAEHKMEASFAFSFPLSPLSIPPFLPPPFPFFSSPPFPFLCWLVSKGRLEKGAQDGILCP